MTINIQKLIDELNTRASLADSNTSTNEMLKLNNTVLRLNNSTGVVEATAKSSLPVPVDSAMLGNIAFVSRGPDTDSAGIGNYADSHGGYYMARTIGNTIDSCWSRLRLSADSDAENTEVGGGDLPQGGIGSAYGYAAGGATQYSDVKSNVIEKYSFTSDGNSTDVGDLAYYMAVQAGASSTTDGYTMAGSGNTSNPSPTSYSYKHIQKYSFATDGNATDIADTAVLTDYHAQGAESTEHGYIMKTLDAERFPFATDENAVDIGDLIHRNTITGATSSATHIYSTGANPSHPSTRGHDIEKFAFSSSISSTDVGDLILGVLGTSSNKSSTFGYITGGYGSPTGATPVHLHNAIQKFSFATDGNATDVGDLTGARWYASSSSSTTHGYVAGGASSTPTAGINVIQKFDTATDGNATDVGDLTVSMSKRAGAQV